MKKVIYSLLICLTLTSLWSCKDKDSYDDSKVTYFVEMSLKGDDAVTIAKGSTFNDPGAVAMEGTNDISSKIVVTSDVDLNVVGMYTITYKATNVDGYSSSVSRTVTVYDPSAPSVDISGTYTVASGTYRLRDGAITKYSGQTVTITKVLPGIYKISDYLGGYYDQRAAYGPEYALVGYFQLDTDNSVINLSSKVKAWGDSLTKLKNAKYDPSTGAISFDAVYASMDFFVTLTK